MGTIYNPYPAIGSQLVSGLNAIISGLPAGSTTDTLVDQVAHYITVTYYSGSGTITQVEIKSVAYNIINVCNSKINWAEYDYSPEQISIISMMVGQRTLSGTSLNSLESWFANIKNSIGNSSLSITQQTPLLLALQIAESSFNYWNTVVAVPGSWSTYFESDSYKNYLNIGLWTVACVYGALIGANATQKGLIAPITDMVSVSIISALTGALAFGAGKVAFKWVAEIQASDMQNFQGYLTGGFSDAIEMGGMEPLFSVVNHCTVVCMNVQCDNDKCKNTKCFTDLVA